MHRGHLLVVVFLFSFLLLFFYLYSSAYDYQFRFFRRITFPSLSTLPPHDIVCIVSIFVLV